jgi:pilus assembly protein Flp/PilA
MVRYLDWARFMGTWVVTRAKITSERGATAVEYGVMVALIAAVIIAAVLALGQQASDTFQCTADSIAARSDSC